MTELHQLYESILNTEIDRRNFARKILDAEYIINTGMKRERAKNRAPELFRFNKKLRNNNFSLNKFFLFFFYHNQASHFTTLTQKLLPSDDRNYPNS